MRCRGLTGTAGWVSEAHGFSRKIRSGRNSVEQVAEESEAFARALARMGRLDLEAELQVVIDPHDRLVL